MHPRLQPLNWFVLAHAKPLDIHMLNVVSKLRKERKFLYQISYSILVLLFLAAKILQLTDAIQSVTCASFFKIMSHVRIFRTINLFHHGFSMNMKPTCVSNMYACFDSGKQDKKEHVKLAPKMKTCVARFFCMTNMK